MELPKRKPVRLSEYDYSQNGAYFLTLCSMNKARIFGRFVGDGVLDVPNVELTQFGKIVEQTLNEMMAHYTHISVEKYVIMPNHLHILMLVHSGSEAFGTSRTPSPTNSHVASFVSTLKRFSNRKSGQQLFQRSYFDHVIRNDNDYLAHWKYIDENPVRWLDDELFVN